MSDVACCMHHSLRVKVPVDVPLLGLPCIPLQLAAARLRGVCGSIADCPCRLQAPY